ncbi:MAG: hypothetical protein K5829_00660 [Treponema sp.]|nr:hypothetical protein [Treponema sp.]
MKKKFLTFVCVLFIGCFYSYSLESYLGLGAGVSFEGECDSIFLEFTFRDLYSFPITGRVDLLFEEESVAGFGVGFEGGISINFLDVFAGLEEAVIWNREYSEIEFVLKINAATQVYINELFYIKPNVMYVIKVNHNEFTISDKNKVLLVLSAGIRI